MLKLSMAFFTAVSLIISSVVANAAFKFEKGDNVCLIGNSLPDRFNHDGWFENRDVWVYKGSAVHFFSFWQSPSCVSCLLFSRLSHVVGGNLFVFACIARLGGR